LRGGLETGRARATREIELAQIGQQAVGRGVELCRLLGNSLGPGYKL
jgi:hypothetical protein